MFCVIYWANMKEIFWQYLNQLKIHMQIIYEYQHAFLVFRNCGLIPLLLNVLSKLRHNRCAGKIQSRRIFPQHITESLRHRKVR